MVSFLVENVVILSLLEIIYFEIYKVLINCCL